MFEFYFSCLNLRFILTANCHFAFFVKNVFVLFNSRHEILTFIELASFLIACQYLDWHEALNCPTGFVNRKKTF